MSFNLIKGIYQHTPSKKLYDVIGIGRSVENPHQLVVIYINKCTIYEIQNLYCQKDQYG